MKKINEKQRSVIKFFQKQLSFFEKTNDIDSLTHMSDIFEESYVLDDYLSADEILKIEKFALNMYQTIKTLEQ